jgi:hypothetical protein
MLHRIVSRSVVVLAATAFLASCEDNTTGTPLTPPPASTAVYVNVVEPDGGYATEQRSVTLLGVDTVVTVADPDPVFEVLYPDGTPAVGQVVTFNVNLPGFVQQSKDTVDAEGLVSPGYWVMARPCPPLTAPETFCRGVQRIIATPVSGNTGFIDVAVDTTTIVPPDLHASR